MHFFGKKVLLNTKNDTVTVQGEYSGPLSWFSMPPGSETVTASIRTIPANDIAPPFHLAAPPPSGWREMSRTARFAAGIDRVSENYNPWEDLLYPKLPAEVLL